MPYTDDQVHHIFHKLGICLPEDAEAGGGGGVSDRQVLRQLGRPSLFGLVGEPARPTMGLGMGLEAAPTRHHHQQQHYGRRDGELAGPMFGQRAAAAAADRYPNELLGQQQPRHGAAAGAHLPPAVALFDQMQNMTSRYGSNRMRNRGTPPSLDQRDALAINLRTVDYLCKGSLYVDPHSDYEMYLASLAALQFTINTNKQSQFVRNVDVFDAPSLPTSKQSARRIYDQLGGSTAPAVAADGKLAGRQHGKEQLHKTAKAALAVEQPPPSAAGKAGWQQRSHISVAPLASSGAATKTAKTRRESLDVAPKPTARGNSALAKPDGEVTENAAAEKSVNDTASEKGSGDHAPKLAKSKMEELWKTEALGGGALVVRRDAAGQLDVIITYARDYMLHCAASPFAALPPPWLPRTAAELFEILRPLPSRFDAAQYRVAHKRIFATSQHHFGHMPAPPAAVPPAARHNDK